MSFVKLPHCPLESDSHPLVRPRFNQQNTQDRLREAARRPSPFSMISNIRKDRKSVFKEVGLAPEDAGAMPDFDEKHAVEAENGPAPLYIKPAEAGSTADHAHVEDKDEKAGTDDMATEQESDQGDSNRIPESEPSSPQSLTSKTPWYAKIATGKRPRVRTGSSTPPTSFQGLPKLTMVVLALALIIPFSGRGSRDTVGLADAGPIKKKAKSPTDVCARWAMQTAVLNGTLFIYGGEAKTTMDQENDTWNNDLVTLDLTSTWDTSSPSITGLTQPSGPPAVALGTLWYDYNSLYLYGGEFSDNPYVEPAAVATWQYSVSDGIWTEYSNPLTSSGNNSDGGGVAVQRAAEGAGVSVPELGLSWYFGGHLDLSTTPGWSDQVARVYLKTLLEFTHPGYSNDGVTSLIDSGAPTSGTYRNITQGGLQTTDGFTERADGVLVFVPGWGTSGVLIGLGGGTESDFTNDTSTLDVYDIANSVWYHQQTTGTAPGVRVNPCAVIASAPDASSFQIYLHGGQSLQPAGDQIQYDDMYILTIPSFTWIGPVSQGGSNIPYARAGHTCNLRDGQMVVVGGFNTTVATCDSPGIYVFNASSLNWGSSFTALAPSADLDPGNSVLASSYGYTVPDDVVSVIGGNPSGSATVTAPAVSPTGGPFATGSPPVFTVTASGSTATITSPGQTGVASASNNNESNGASPGLIAAIVVACLAGVTAGYLGYCAWLYRRQVRAYKTHLAVTNRFPARSASHASFFFGAFGGRKQSRKGRLGLGERAAAAGWFTANEHKEKRDPSSTSGEESFAWVGRDRKSGGGDIDVAGGGLLDSNRLTPSSGAASNRPSAYGDDSKGGSYQSGTSPGETSASGSGGRPRRSSTSGGSTTSSTEGLLEGQEPSFFSVVLGPRRALRVVNGLEDGEGGHQNTAE
ncbi:Kelch domain-containing protein 4 [Cytospora mali]|uniref:Kelch domain-containing protein 4 n=1 Tax=Cytospora mali TaxID=578113 RepID=A0A194VH30_CYTMA|nr:Kelch domain-containing protein 4 [Valsa mali]